MTNIQRKFIIAVYGLLVIATISILSIFILKDEAGPIVSAITTAIASTGGSITAFIIPILFGYNSEYNNKQTTVDVNKGLRKFWISIIGMTIIFAVSVIAILFLDSDAGAIGSTIISTGVTMTSIVTSIMFGYSAEYKKEKP